MEFVKKEHKKFNKRNYASFILAGDIGGTNTNLGVFGIKNNIPQLLVSFHVESNKIKGLHYAVNEILNYTQKNYKIKISKACFAIAGILSSNKSFAEVTNIKWNVSKKSLVKKTKLKNIVLINDFEAVGYGINILDKKDIRAIKKGKKVPKANILVIGAGTGLGKSTLIYDKSNGAYTPNPSEAGHTDFAAQTNEELDLINFIKKYKKVNNVSYEFVLSGQGLSNIYSFLRKSRKFKQTEYTREIDKSKNQPELISKCREIDATCKAVFKIFKEVYAKFARNFALDCLAYGGVYIAGGIAPKNLNIFDKKFAQIFMQNQRHARTLKDIPIYLILNYNAGLWGAGFAATRLAK